MVSSRLSRQGSASSAVPRLGRSNLCLLVCVVTIGAYFVWNQREVESLWDQRTETIAADNKARTEALKSSLAPNADGEVSEEDLEKTMGGDENDDDDRMAQDFNLGTEVKNEDEDDDDMFAEDDDDDDDDDDSAVDDGDTGETDDGDDKTDAETEDGDNHDARKDKQPMSAKTSTREIGKGDTHAQREKVKRVDSTTPSMWTSFEMAMEPDANTAAIRGPKPLFQCTQERHTPTENKLVFVHVFKTAGTTMRTLFFQYASFCHVGYAVVIHCSDAMYRSIPSYPLGKKAEVHAAWLSKSSRRACPIKVYVPRSAKRSEMRVGLPAKTFFLRDNVDIIAGHLPLGAGMVYEKEVYPLNLHGKYGEVENSRPDDSKVRYVTFFRDATEKFVSGVNFVLAKKDATEEKLVKEVRRKVTAARAKGEHHLKYAQYLLTPQQQHERRSKEFRLTAAEVTAQVMQNILDYDVVCGVTEYMSESLAMIEYMIDPRGNAWRLFLQYGREPRHAMRNGRRHMQRDMVQRERRQQPPEWRHRRLQKDQTLRRKRRRRMEEMDEARSRIPRSNTSRISTSAVVAKLKEDEEFFAELMEYVKYEQQITDFAIAVHKRQFELLQEERVPKQ